MRAGTENVAGIAGFAAAVKDSERRLQPASRSTGFSLYPAAYAFERHLTQASVEGLALTLEPTVPRLPGHAHLRVAGISAETLLIRLDRAGVSASAGAACSSGSLEASHVLLACGYSEEEAKEGVRFSFGREQPEDLGREAAEGVIRVVGQIRARVVG